MENSADPVQIAPQKSADLDLHKFLKRMYPDSAGQGLTTILHTFCNVCLLVLSKVSFIMNSSHGNI